MKIKKNDIIELEITDITNLGFGVGKHSGIVVFVSDAVPGDIVTAKIIKATSSYLVGRVEKYIKKSELRVADRCKNERCRSCAYKSLSYGYELKLKEDMVRAAFIKAGLSDIEIKAVTPSPLELEYRNKAQYPVKLRPSGEYLIGFYAPKSHNVCEAADCPLSHPTFESILNTLRGFFKKHGISAYDEARGRGLLRHIYLRRAEETGEILLTLVVTDEKLKEADDLVKTVTAAHPEIVGILLNVNSENTNIILGESFITLFGRDYIEDTLAGVKLRISAPSFYQVNHGTAELIYKRARALAELRKSDTLLDLYCGAGSIGLSMAEDAGELIGIEIVPEAVECATLNAVTNGVKNAKFYTGDATETEKLLSAAEADLGKAIRPDVIVLDPPRGGCSEELLRFVDKLTPRRIVYISCNPTTLARDVKILKDLGFACSAVEPFDMFPMTGHVESLVCLRRQTN